MSQEVSVVLWEKFAEFGADVDFRAWAFGVARFGFTLRETWCIDLSDEPAKRGQVICGRVLTLPAAVLAGASVRVAA